MAFVRLSLNCIVIVIVIVIVTDLVTQKCTFELFVQSR